MRNICYFSPFPASSGIKNPMKLCGCLKTWTILPMLLGFTIVAHCFASNLFQNFGAASLTRYLACQRLQGLSTHGQYPCDKWDLACVALTPLSLRGITVRHLFALFSGTPMGIKLLRFVSDTASVCCPPCPTAWLLHILAELLMLTSCFRSGVDTLTVEP